MFKVGDLVSVKVGLRTYTKIIIQKENRYGIFKTECLTTGDVAWHIPNELRAIPAKYPPKTQVLLCDGKVRWLNYPLITPTGHLYYKIYGSHLEIPESHILSRWCSEDSYAARVY
jgi:hypothetical protein